MQEPLDDSLETPPDVQPAASADGPTEDVAALTDAAVLQTAAAAPLPIQDVPAPESRAVPASVRDVPDALNLAERLVAELGAWAGMLAERWAPSLGPFFASDGRMAVDSEQIRAEPESPLSTSIC